MTYPELVAQVQQLPVKHQLQLVQTVTKQVGHHFNPQQPALFPLISLDRSELQTVAEAIVSPDHQTALHTLLQKQHEEQLSDVELQRLDELLAEVDRVALLKAKALYTLRLYDSLLEEEA